MLNIGQTIIEALPESVREVCQRLADASHEVHLVGGAVRDAFREKPATDFDIATSALPEQVQQCFPRVIETGIEHGTVTVIARDGEPVEITTYRNESAYTDGRHPDQVSFVRTIEEDLARRDFTVNAIAISYPSMEVKDPFGGRQDLRDSVLRTVGEASERFTEDGLRLLRAARFAATLQMSVDPRTRAAMESCAHRLEAISVERIRVELEKTLGAEKPSVGLSLMADTGLLERIIPEFSESYGFPQNHWHSHDVFGHTLHVVDAAPVDKPEVRLAALFHDIGKPRCAGGEPGEHTFYDHQNVSAKMADNIMKKLRFPNKTRENVVRLVKGHMWQYSRDWGNGAVRRFVAKAGGVEKVDDLLDLRRADSIGRGDFELESSHSATTALSERIQALMDEEQALHVTDLAISGKEVMQALGTGPSRSIGQALEWLLLRVQDDAELNTSEALLNLLEEFKDNQLKNK